MTDPVTAITASTIATLAFQEFVKSGAGELAKKFTTEAIAKMNALRQKIWDKMRGKPTAEAAIESIKQGSTAEMDRLVAYLQVAMDDDPAFADEMRLMAHQINAGKIQDNSNMTQNNSDHAKGWQTRVEGGTAYIGEIHIHGEAKD
jgi:hypothetical protein